MNEPWRISLLGGLRVEGNQTTITRFNTQKTAGLLAYLAYFLRNMSAREVLIDTLWSDATPEAGRHNLSVALSTLRNQLEPLGVSTGGVIRADRYSVGLNPAAVTTDVAEFNAALLFSKKTSTTTERAQLLMQALDLYQGRLLPGLYDEWITAEQQRLSGRFFDATNQLLTHLTEIGDITTALDYARKAVSIDPLHEEANRSLMSLLVTAGQPGSALGQFKEFERRLEEESGDEPSAQLRALARHIEKESGLGHLIVVAPVRSSPPTLQPSSLLHVGAGQPPLSDTVTFLMTDVEGFARHGEQDRDTFKQALERHLELLRGEFTQSGGQVIREGASCLVVFASARKALNCAVACQTALSSEVWTEVVGTVEVHIALDTGDVEVRDDGYHGPAVQQVSRMLTAAHGSQILISESTAAMVRNNLSADGIHLIDLGVYQLRDTPGLHRLFQVDYPGMGNSVFPPLAAIAGHPSQLPLRFTRFFGRGREIAELSEMLRSPEVALVTVTGTGGTGKTRFVLEVAERLIESFEGAVYFVSLAEVLDASLVWDALLTVLRVPRNPNREPMEQVIEALNRQPSLLILDNMEQLVAMGGAEVVQTLISRVPTLKALVTSRQLLSLSAEREFALSPLPIPNGGESPEHLSVFESVQLFLDRAQIVKPDFRVTNHNAASVAELVSRLEGIPLAIELAAARVQVLTPLQMLVQLEERFRFLVSHKRDVTERHRTLHAAMDWSYRLLAPELQRFFCRLSVFRGGWTVKAAEQVCEEPLALDYLALLRECSLVLSDATEAAVRFHFLEMVREFAWDQMRSFERTSAQVRSTYFYLHVVEETAPNLAGPFPTPWLVSLEAEQDNLRAALYLCTTAIEAQELETGLRFAKGLLRFWEMRGYVFEGCRWAEAALAHPLAQEPTALRAEVLTSAGGLLTDRGEYARAGLLLQESLSIQRQCGDEDGVAAALNNLALLAYDLDDFDQAEALLEESMVIRFARNDKPGIACGMMNLARAVCYRKDYAKARELLEGSILLYRELENARGIALAMGNLGSVAREEGDWATALSWDKECLRMHSQSGNITGQIGKLEEIASLGCLQMEQLEHAARLFGAARQMRDATGFAAPAYVEANFKRDAEILRDTLGETSFHAFLVEGRTMVWEQAVASALLAESA
ncbi:MAG: BTAD domain-containing putative transcriptional regulator [Armatimonadetes bacterium]|nr:BTAD domain-containing putative transcriptional regulator [Armatimonadota bacterium]